MLGDVCAVADAANPTRPAKINYFVMLLRLAGFDIAYSKLWFSSTRSGTTASTSSKVGD